MKATTRIRSVAITLRVAATALVAGGLASFMPEPWKDSILASYGLGPMPHEVLMRYMAFGAGYFQITTAILLWVISRDVVRYRPLVVASSVIFLAGAPAFYLINASAGMPRWCGIVDCVCCLLIGGTMLACSRPSEASPDLH